MLKNECMEIKENKTEDSKRLRLVLEHLNINANRFAAGLKLSGNAMIYHILRGRNGIGETLAYKMSIHYPQINTEWFLTGKGEMIIEPKEDETSLGKRLDQLEKIVESNKIKIELQSSYIKNFELQIENFKLKTAK